MSSSCCADIRARAWLTALAAFVCKISPAAIETSVASESFSVESSELSFLLFNFDVEPGGLPRFLPDAEPVLVEVSVAFPESELTSCAAAEDQFAEMPCIPPARKGREPTLPCVWSDIS